jgi:hypothetical protein
MIFKKTWLEFYHLLRREYNYILGLQNLNPDMPREREWFSLMTSGEQTSQQSLQITPHHQGKTEIKRTEHRHTQQTTNRRKQRHCQEFDNRKTNQPA